MKSISNTIIILVTIVAGALVMSIFYRGFYASSADATDSTVMSQEKFIESATSTKPVALSIPRLGVHAKVQKVGISKRGRMAVPTNYADVGWYRLGPAPGSNGKAVVAGHLDNGFGLPAVFRNLDDLTDGDEVLVTDEQGTTFRFEVTGKTRLISTTSSTEDIFTTSGPPQLVLITCEGEWDPQAKSYSHRIVVFAKLAEII